MDELAKTGASVAEAVGKAVDLCRDIGSFFGRALGTVPEDLIGLYGGDALRAKRNMNLDRLARGTEEELKRRSVQDIVEVTPSILIPLLGAAADESREELQKVWARLLATAMDKERSGQMRQSFLAAVRGMDPTDAIVFQEYDHNRYRQASGQLSILTEHQAIDLCSRALAKDRIEIQASLDRLRELGCMRPGAMSSAPEHSPLGTLLLRALRS